jgi:hypothetical protein
VDAPNKTSCKRMDRAEKRMADGHKAREQVGKEEGSESERGRRPSFCRELRNDRAGEPGRMTVKLDGLGRSTKSDSMVKGCHWPERG